MEIASFLSLGPETDTSHPPQSVVHTVAKPTGPRV